MPAGTPGRDAPAEGERPVGRRAKLTDDLLEKICADLYLGLSERETYEAAGIPERSWFEWKARARAAQDILPEEWEQLKFAELLAVAEELDIDVNKIHKSGHNGRLTRADVLLVIRDRAERYVVFLRRIEAAARGTDAKRAILERVDDMVQGRIRVKRTRTVQRIQYVRVNGQMRPEPFGDAIVTTEILELPPDRQAALKILEMRWPEEFGRRRGESPEDAEVAAREVTDRVRRMLSTVPPPPALPPAAGEAIKK